MHKKWIINTLLFLCCLYGAQSSGMESVHTLTKEPFINIRWFAKDLQTHILLKQTGAPCKKIIRFLLARQPTTITLPTDWTNTALSYNDSPKPSIKIRGDNLIVKTHRQFNTWNIVAYDLNDGTCIKGAEKKLKEWEINGLMARINKHRAARIIFDGSGFRKNKTGLWDTQTNEQIYTTEYEDDIDLLTTHNDEAIVVLYNQKVIAWDTLTNTTRPILQNRDTNNRHYISSIAVYGDNIIIGTHDGLLEMWDIAHDKLLHSFQDHTTKISAIKVTKNIILTGSRNGVTHIWRINTDDPSGPNFKLLRILTDPGDCGKPISFFATQRHTVATASKDGIIKIWTLRKNLEKLPETDPLAWLLYATDVPQLHFILQAHKATQTDQEFVLDLPNDFTTLHDDETTEQTYGRIFVTFPHHIRAYLCHYLNIRRLKSVQKKYQAHQEQCAIM